MRMRRAVTATIAASLLYIEGAIGFAIAGEPRPELVGKWQSRTVQIEFRADGTYIARPRQRGRKATEGSWSLIDHQHVATWTDESRPRRVNKFVVRKPYLIITESGGRLHVHERVQDKAVKAKK